MLFRILISKTYHIVFKFQKRFLTFNMPLAFIELSNIILKFIIKKNLYTFIIQNNEQNY